MPINGKGYGQEWVKWKKDKLYRFRVADEHERKVGIVYYIENERESYWSPIKEKEFNKYFVDPSKLRDEIIESILN